MQRHLWAALIACSLALPSAASAFDGPEVPDEALSRAPGAVQESLHRRDVRVEQMTRELEATRSAMALAASVDALAAARQELRAALTEASNLRGIALSDQQTVRLSQVEARIRLDLAKLRERNARDQLQAAHDARQRGAVRDARRRFSDAKDLRDAAREDLTVAADVQARTGRATEDQLEVAEHAMATARQALNEVGAVRGGVDRRRVGPAELALLEARRDLAAAELQHDRAQAAIESGMRLRIRPYLDALEEARSVERAAREGLGQAASAHGWGGSSPAR